MSQIIYTFPSSSSSLSIEGAGIDSTILTWPSNGGFEINYNGPYNSLYIHDLSLTGGTTTGGNALYLHQTATTIYNPANSSLNNISHVAIRGGDGYELTDYWGAAIYDYGVSNINLDGVSITGASSVSGFGLQTAGLSTAPPVVVNVAKSFFNGLNTGIYIGQYTQGVSLSQDNMTWDHFGIYIPSNSIGPELNVSGSQIEMDSSGNDGIYFNGDYADVALANNVFYVESNKAAIGIANGQRMTIEGNSFVSLGTGSSQTTTAIAIDGNDGANSSTILGNSFNGFSNGGTGIYVASGTSGWNIQNNAYYNNTNNINNLSTGNFIGNITNNANPTNVTASRTLNTTYTNNTGRPLVVYVTITSTLANTYMAGYINNASVGTNEISTTGQQSCFTLIVPAGFTYSISTTNNPTLTSWVED